MVSCIIPVRGAVTDIGVEDTPWDLETVVKTAEGFADKVYRCPQLVRVVLTKYTAVRSWWEQMPGCVLLEYENTGVYMADLLDSYMEVYSC